MVLCVGAAASFSRALAAFQVPIGEEWATWEAEAAARYGPWREISDPTASSGKYVEGSGDNARLEFTFRTDAPTNLALKPLWWRTGERKAARRFPYPLDALPGPDVVVACEGKVFFTAPAAGRVGFVDGQGTLRGYLQVGGYLTDMVADEATGRLYVADALGNRVVVIDARRREATASVKTPLEPWSLALGSGRLLVACRAGRCLCVLDAASLKIITTVGLPAPPVSVAVDAKSPDSALVRFQQRTFDVRSMDEIAADELQYGVCETHRSVTWAGRRTFDSPRAHVVRVWQKGQCRNIDVSFVTAARSGGQASAGLARPGPQSFALYRNYVLFTAPAAGRVGVMDAAAMSLVKAIQVGGQPTEILADGDTKRAYVADTAGGRVVVLDLDKLEVAKEIKVEGGPWGLAVVGTVAWQRPELVPPTPINKLFVTCRATRKLAVVDLAKDAVVKTIPLEWTPRGVGYLGMPNTGWWPLLAAEKISFALTPRVVVEPAPALVDLRTRAVNVAPDWVAAAAPKRSAVKAKVGGQMREFRCDNQLLLQAGDKLVNVSAVADYQLAANRPLRKADVPGSITFRLDDGAELDWTRNIWLRPDDNVLLVNDTEEFWRWNAPKITVGPGTHKITITARGECVRLDGIQVARTAEPVFGLQVRPEPWSLHSQVPSGAYQGVFYDTEPVRFSVQVTGRLSTPERVDLSTELRNYLDERVAARKPIRLCVAAGHPATAVMEFAPRDTGRFTLFLRLQTRYGSLTKEVRFVRLPKLEHPRLFFRKDDLPAISKRMAEHPQLFRRYADWLARMCGKSGLFPERFLPNGLTRDELAKAAPPGTRDPGAAYGWRMYELGARMLAVAFAARYIPGADRKALETALEPLLKKPSTDWYCQYHYHGPFFPGAVAALVDMAPDDVRQKLPLTKFFAQRRGNMDVYPWTLVSLEEPLTPADRALVYRIATLETNFERYFETHEGIRGGTLWQNPWSWCYCPTQGIFLSLLFTRNLLGEERLFEKTFLRGYLTFMYYADPISDARRLLPATRRPSGEPWRWVMGAIVGHPLQKAEYPWDEWVRKLDGDLPPPEPQAVDDLFALKGMPMSGPLAAAPHHFATGVAVPLALALGWYDPSDATVTRDELPPSALFDVEGLAAMRSGWDKEATEVAFWCGARDHTTRHQPGHLTVVRGGEFLLGTPALWADDGNCTPSWGNTVVFGDNWIERWRINLQHPRAEEYALINRFSPATWTYIARERRLNGYSPAEGGWGGGVDLHGHTETLFVGEGKIIAYETHPEYDYVAGDATNAWPVEEARQHTRQVIFLKPNVIVVYDRAIPGPQVKTCRWIAATGPALALRGHRFSVKVGSSALWGEFLLPRNASFSEPMPLPYYQWKGQRMLQVEAAPTANGVEFLAVLTVGDEKVQAAQATVQEQPDAIVLTVSVNGQPVTLRLNRVGPVGGAITLPRGTQPGTPHELTQTVEDTYVHWASDPRYARWTREPRFSFVIPPCDRNYAGL